MSRRLSRISLALVFLLAGEAWALGLGEIKLHSALNEPLHAEIELLSATPEELAGLEVSMASGETFTRYGLDRPAVLSTIQFRVNRSGQATGNVVEIRSAGPITEPFVTFLVEASWARGRLLREYTVLLDPPTFTPPAAAQQMPAVTAPTRSQPADSARIERPAPSQPVPEEKAPVRTSPPVTSRPAASQPPPRPSTDADRPFDSSPGGEITVLKGETLWGITTRVRDDGRLTMNQTMLAIFEANPQAFAGNVNVLLEGATLRIPSADNVYQIGKQTAFDEMQRQHAEWQPGYEYVEGTAADGTADPVDDYTAIAEEPVDAYVDESVDDAVTQNDLTLVPPDEDYLGDSGTSYDDVIAEDPTGREAEIEQRIAELEAADVPVQQSLIEIRDNELAALREELARIRGEVYEPGLDDPFATDDATDDAVADAVTEPVDDVVDETPAEAEPTARPTRRAEPTLMEKVTGALSNMWLWVIVAVVVIVGGLLFWFMRRGGDDDGDVTDWRSLDSSDGATDLSATESMQAPRHDESIVVVEQESALPDLDETVEAESPAFAAEFEDDSGTDGDVGDAGSAPAEPESIPFEQPAAAEETGRFDSLEDTFSSETAINLDQSDPMAEADFHMAYGLYDQAADLVNAAVANEPERQDLLSKLCEIYFVWGNRDAFIDAASRLKAAVGDVEDPEWDKIVIMGQQIAADDEMFAGAGVAAATKAVDLSFDADDDGTGALDMEFGDDAGDASDVLDLSGGESVDEDSGDDL
ncbi:MAG: type IV pilus assembly protein FimV, partial [Woeseiaceae bacterium]